MELNFLVKGLIIGFSIAAPVGPIGVLCIRRTLAYGRPLGFLSGLGAATADAMYGLVAALGLTLISAYLLDQQFWLKLVGGTFLLYLGLKTLRTGTTSTVVPVTGRSLLNAYSSTLFLTLTNPATILSFMAIYAGLGLADTQRNYGDAGSLVLGVFTGSAIWWLLLSGGVSLFRGRFTVGGLRWVNRLAGLILCAFGLLVWLSFVT
jgi:threonine/homoserine/homoserine lactone efflux protein